jgi:RimJ/RimL family protein N-acetyltransferase
MLSKIYTNLKLFVFNEKLNLSDFHEITIILDDNWNKIPRGSIWKCYFEKNDNNIEKINIEKIKDRYGAEEICAKSIGYIHYRIGTGQIGLFFIKEKYKNKGLGKQILTKTIEHMKLSKNEYVWAVTSTNHPFWSNVFGKAFKYSKKLHPSVTGDGYMLNIKHFETLKLKNLIKS